MKADMPAAGSINSFSLKQIFDDREKEEHGGQYTGNDRDAIKDKAGKFLLYNSYKCKIMFFQRLICKIEKRKQADHIGSIPVTYDCKNNR